MIKAFFIICILYSNIFALTAVHWGSLPADAIRPEEARHWSNKTYYYPVTACPAGYTQTTGSEISLGVCKKVVVTTLIPTSTLTDTSYIFTNISGGDRYEKIMSSSSCTGKKMTASGYTTIATPYYGSNGICYSNTGLYCHLYSGSTSKIQLPNGKQVLCWDELQNCGDSSYTLVYNFSGTSDKCSRFSYSCSVGNLYGLATHPTNNNTLDLFNKIGSKDAKATTNITTLLVGDKIVNDNNGAMCVQLGNSSFSQPLVSPSYNIPIQKSGF